MKNQLAIIEIDTEEFFKFTDGPETYLHTSCFDLIPFPGRVIPGCPSPEYFIFY
jgi:hypothetical protein